MANRKGRTHKPSKKNGLIGDSAQLLVKELGETITTTNKNMSQISIHRIRRTGRTRAENITVRLRAKAACEYAKELNPELSTWYQSKVTKASSYVGRVLLAAKGVKEPE